MQKIGKIVWTVLRENCTWTNYPTIPSLTSTDVEHVLLGRYSWLVSDGFFWRTGLRIFLIFCMNVPYYQRKKRTRRFFRENSCSLIIHENVLKNGLFLGFLTLSGF